ncbi:peptide-methionine (S)-S-oxide reductase MsrA [Salinibacter altiplanensis]|uniref:peptide-methionine (S)-S-oxide reductase MsrA n=1 Tax=Salinibacter altiplanensis TaxID=1803181 RepID=UPI000C9FBAF7|nr:peptide-methionine (S)-S-oxide reductase MsrA [Salinibacter altiplanensis]
MNTSYRSPWFVGLALFAIVATSGLFLYPSSSPKANAPTTTQTSSVNPAVADTATFAGGCFWCMEPPYDKMDGVASTTSGFAGGEQVDPSYREVASGTTKHTEVVQIVYDSTTVSYDRLLRVYWHNVDPFDGTGQFCDRGAQYRPAIFAHSARQQRLAEQSKEAVASRFDPSIAVEIEPLDAFYAAERYHQDYYKKNPADYKRYRQGCGRDARLREVWGAAAMSDAVLDGTT